MDFLNTLLKTLMLLTLMLPTFAQENDEEDEGLEVVVTTATKTEKDEASISKVLGDYVVPWEWNKN